MDRIVGSFRNIERHILFLIIAECFIQLINAAFMLSLLIYMKKSGYTDAEGASFIKYRFLSVLLLSVPLGYFIRGRKIIPLFYVGCTGVPLFSLAVINSIEHHSDFWLSISQFLWGAAFVCIQVSALPYIMRNASKSSLTESISLSHATWSIGGILSGLLFFVFRKYDPVYFSDGFLLTCITCIAFLALFFVISMPKNEHVEDKVSSEKNYDWIIILRALIPTSIIATGAGLTIPFISYFFYEVHGIDSDRFSLFYALALGMVFIGALLVPFIKRKLGFRKAIPLTQSLAVAALIGIAASEYFKDYEWMLPMAVFCYLIRQPLMNMASPMTAEVTMKYVGKKNQEMMSALTASIWSGSWFISAWIVQILRDHGTAYMQIFLVTAGIYTLGIISFMFLINEFERRTDPS